MGIEKGVQLEEWPPYTILLSQLQLRMHVCNNSWVLMHTYLTLMYNTPSNQDER